MRCKVVGGTKDSEKRALVRRDTIVLSTFGTLKREVKARHVPSNCHDFIICHFKPTAKKAYHRFLAMPEWERRCVKNPINPNQTPSLGPRFRKAKPDLRKTKNKDRE